MKRSEMVAIISRKLETFRPFKSLDKLASELLTILESSDMAPPKVVELAEDNAHYVNGVNINPQQYKRIKVRKWDPE